MGASYLIPCCMHCSYLEVRSDECKCTVLLVTELCTVCTYVHSRSDHSCSRDVHSYTQPCSYKKEKNLSVLHTTKLVQVVVRYVHSGMDPSLAEL